MPRPRAASRGHLDIVTMFLDFGVPADQQDDYGTTALYRCVLMHACIRYPLCVCARA